MHGGEQGAVMLLMNLCCHWHHIGLLVVASTNEGLSARGQALGGVVLMLGYIAQWHLAHEGVAPLILLIWPRLKQKK